MDIVERLRDTTGIHEELMYEAADEIERLREDRKRLRLALEDIADFDGGDVTKLWKEMRDIARAALKEGE